MSFKLTKDERQQLSSLQNDLRERTDRLITLRAPKIGDSIPAADSLDMEWRASVDAYNLCVNDIDEFRETTRERLQDEHDGKSTRWQESDAGSAAYEMIRVWEEFHIDEIDPDVQIDDDELIHLRDKVKDFDDLQVEAEDV